MFYGLDRAPSTIPEEVSSAQDPGCCDVGMDDDISKPFQVDQSVAILDRWLPDPQETRRPFDSQVEGTG